MSLMSELSQMTKPASGLGATRFETLPKQPPPRQAEASAAAQVQQRLWHGQKLETLGRLAAGIAHDFGNLVTVILGYSKLLENNLGPGDPRHDLLGEIHKAGLQADRLTRQIVRFASPQATEPEVLDLGQVLRGMERMLRRLIGDIFLSTAIPAAPALVRADHGQLQQIIVNLAVNARDAMPDGGTLMIDVAPVELEGRDANGNSMRQRGQTGNTSYVMISFQDNGTGMSQDVRARIFEPFFTTKEAGKGTGLGLSMVDEIVKQHGGHIEVQSEPGQGSTFKVFLPASQEALAVPQLDTDVGPLPTGTEVILLVEDETPVRQLVRHVLHLCGYTVLEAVDGLEAVRLAEEHKGPIHLLLSDVVMPNMGGCQLADKVRRGHPELKVLFLSGHSISFVFEQGANPEEFAFLQKPFTVAALAIKVREVLSSLADTKHD